MQSYKSSGYQITVLDDGSAMCEDVRCASAAAAEQVAAGWLAQEEYEGYCDGEAARRTDHQADE